MVKQPAIRPHTHADRTRIIEQLVPLFRQKFGDDLLAVASCASYARGEDQSYSDLELVVFLRNLPVGGDPYLQRIVDGMLIEAEYTSPAAFLDRYRLKNANWVYAASEKLEPVVNPNLIAQIKQERAQIHLDVTARQRVLSRQFVEVFEAVCKALNAIEQHNREGLPLVFFDAVHHVLVLLGLLNCQPFTTLSRMIGEARTFSVQPTRLGELLDILVEGTYACTLELRDLLLEITADLETLLASEAVLYYDESIDPNLPNLPRTV
jgi:hypothetical protein